MLNWNVRGLNNPNRRDVVRDMVTSTRATIVCLQETKLQCFDDRLIAQTLGYQFTGNYSYLPAAGVRGGILIAVSDNHFRLSSSRTDNTITVRLQMLEDGEEWDITGVYGPQGRQNKTRFIQELKSLKDTVAQKWLITGDFNLIYKAEDKNNNRLNRRLMGGFKQALEHLELKELSLNGRKYTWTNEQENPTMTRIDRMFCTIQWEEAFPTAHLQALASTLSDHCPLFLQGNTQAPKYNGFRFELYWIQMPGFQETVAEAWTKPLQETDALRKIHIKLARTARALKKLQKENIGNIKLQTTVAKEIILRLDVAEEERQLTQEELQFRKRIKLKHQGLIAIEKIKAKQRARLSHIRTADANTKLFHIRANGRRRKKHIQILQTNAGFVVTHEDKANEIHRHFNEQLGSRTERQVTLNWEELQIQSHDLTDLENDITEDEIK